MNEQEYDFSKLDQFNLEVAVDNILDQFGHQAVQDELEKRALKECKEFFGKKISVRCSG
jgi:hypothetical protein